MKKTLTAAIILSQILITPLFAEYKQVSCSGCGRTAFIDTQGNAWTRVGDNWYCKQQSCQQKAELSIRENARQAADIMRGLNDARQKQKSTREQITNNAQKVAATFKELNKQGKWKAQVNLMQRIVNQQNTAIYWEAFAANALPEAIKYF